MDDQSTETLQLPASFEALCGTPEGAYCSAVNARLPHPPNLVTDGVVTRHRDEVEEGGATTLTAEQYTELQAYRRAFATGRKAEHFRWLTIVRWRRPGWPTNPNKRPALTGRFLFRYA